MRNAGVDRQVDIAALSSSWHPRPASSRPVDALSVALRPVQPDRLALRLGRLSCSRRSATFNRTTARALGQTVQQRSSCRCCCAAAPLPRMATSPWLPGLPPRTTPPDTMSPPGRRWSRASPALRRRRHRARTHSPAVRLASPSPISWMWSNRFDPVDTPSTFFSFVPVFLLAHSYLRQRPATTLAFAHLERPSRAARRRLTRPKAAALGG
mmetsp:Transcript_105862/g.338065  ORF Transcript_105862/g.338065 Transcript_105862/m.338065 type:complete len:211 (+) Transcript_105862:199-831(+)